MGLLYLYILPDTRICFIPFLLARENFTLSLDCHGFSTVFNAISNKLAAVTCFIAEVSAVHGRSVCGTAKCVSIYADKN